MFPIFFSSSVVTASTLLEMYPALTEFEDTDICIWQNPAFRYLRFAWYINLSSKIHWGLTSDRYAELLGAVVTLKYTVNFKIHFSKCRWLGEDIMMDKFVIKQIQNVNCRRSGICIDYIWYSLFHHKKLVEDNKWWYQKLLFETHCIEKKSKNVF